MKWRSSNLGKGNQRHARIVLDYTRHEERLCLTFQMLFSGLLQNGSVNLRPLLRRGVRQIHHNCVTKYSIDLFKRKTCGLGHRVSR